MIPVAPILDAQPNRGKLSLSEPGKKGFAYSVQYFKAGIVYLIQFQTFKVCRVNHRGAQTKCLTWETNPSQKYLPSYRLSSLASK